MRWTVRIAALLFVLWAFYVVSPYVAAWRLAAAVQARDLESIRARVNVRAVQTSLARQIVAVHGLSPDRLKAIGFGRRELAAPGNPESGVNRRVEIVNLSR